MGLRCASISSLCSVVVTYAAALSSLSSSFCSFARCVCCGVVPAAFAVPNGVNISAKPAVEGEFETVSFFGL